MPAFELLAITDPTDVAFDHGSVVAYREAHVMSDGSLSVPARVEIEIVLDEVLGRYVADSVRVTRGGGGEVTARLLREVRVQEAILDVALKDLIRIQDYDDEGPTAAVPAAEALDAIEPAKGRPRWSVLQDVKLIDTVSRIANVPPLASVADRLKVSQSTATRLVAETRGNG